MCAEKRNTFPGGYLHSSASYETKIVAFYDFLGWRNKIDWAGDDPERVRLLATIVRMNSLVEHEAREGYSPQRFTSFSDNVVMSIDQGARPIDEVFFRLGCAQFAAAMLGFYIRGAITIGQIVHDDFVVFGPALNRAYELESTVAEYPRIIIDPNVIDKFGELPNFVDVEHDIHFINPYSKWFANRIQQLAENDEHHPKMVAKGVRPPVGALYRDGAMGRLIQLTTRLRQEVEATTNSRARTKLFWILKKLVEDEGLDPSDFWKEISDQPR